MFLCPSHNAPLYPTPITNTHTCTEQCTNVIDKILLPFIYTVKEGWVLSQLIHTEIWLKDLNINLPLDSVNKIKPHSIYLRKMHFNYIRPERFGLIILNMMWTSIPVPTEKQDEFVYKHLPSDRRKPCTRSLLPLPSSPPAGYPITFTHSLWGVPFFREDSQDELALLVRLIRWGDDDILARGEAETLGHLPQVDVGLTARLGGVEQEEVLLHVLLVAVHLQVEGGGNSKREAAQVWTCYSVVPECTLTSLGTCGQTDNTLVIVSKVMERKQDWQERTTREGPVCLDWLDTNIQTWEDWRNGKPHKLQIRWWRGWHPSCALSACSSASAPPQRCSPPRCPRGRHPLPANVVGTEGLSRKCLQEIKDRWDSFISSNHWFLTFLSFQRKTSSCKGRTLVRRPSSGLLRIIWWRSVFIWG